MKKIIKKISFVLSVIFVGLSVMIVPIYADAVSTDTSEVIPYYVGISSTYNNLTWESSGLLKCQGATATWSNHYASVNVELQQYYNSEWNTIKTWYNKNWEYASVSQNWYVSQNYKYRLQVTHCSYDSEGNLLEVVIKYSDIV